MQRDENRHGLRSGPTTSLLVQVGSTGSSFPLLRSRAFGALLVAAGGAGGADDDHATAVAAVLVGGHG